MKKFTTEEIRDLLNQVMLGEISFSRMVEMINERVDEKNEPKYKDGDFVVNKRGDILIFKKKDGDFIYDHAFLGGGRLLFTSVEPSLPGIKRFATEEEEQKMLDALAERGKRWNAEKKCIENIPKRKFKKGDKVRIKHGVSSKTHHSISPCFAPEMDGLIGKTMTVDGYTDCWNKYVMFEGIDYVFLEDWLEPYEELKEGDLAIFWDKNKESAFIGIYKQSLMGVIFQHKDHRGNLWANAIKFESKEQFEKLIKGEI